MYGWTRRFALETVALWSQGPCCHRALLAHLVEVGRGDAEGGRGVVVVSLAEVLGRRDARAALESRQVRVPLESVVL